MRDAPTSTYLPLLVQWQTRSICERPPSALSMMRRPNQADQLRSQLAMAGGSDDRVPMTAALRGRFGSRTTSLDGMPRFEERAAPPPTPHSTTVISGGISLGNLASSNTSNAGAPSESNSVPSWRRCGNNNSVLSGNRTVSSLTPASVNQRTSRSTNR